MLTKSIGSSLIKRNLTISYAHLILLLLLKLLLVHNLLLQIIRTAPTNVGRTILLHQVRLVDYNFHILTSAVRLLMILGVLSCFTH